MIKLNDHRLIIQGTKSDILFDLFLTYFLELKT